jgi:hypothetical protein
MRIEDIVENKELEQEAIIYTMNFSYIDRAEPNSSRTSLIHGPFPFRLMLIGHSDFSWQRVVVPW